MNNQTPAKIAAAQRVLEYAITEVELDGIIRPRTLKKLASAQSTLLVAAQFGHRLPMDLVRRLTSFLPDPDDQVL